MRKVLAFLLTFALVCGLPPAGTYAALPDGAYKTWKQSDSRWAKILMGTSAGSSIGSVGCLATAVAIMAVGYGYRDESDFDPGVFVNEMKAVGGFKSGGAMIYAPVAKVLPGLSFNSEVSLSGKTNAQIADAVQNQLSAGKAVIIKVLNQSSGNTHYTVVDRVEAEKIYICDPGYGSRSELFASYAKISSMLVWNSTLSVWSPDEWAREFVIFDDILYQYNGAGGDVSIPRGVTAIPISAFRFCASLTGIVIPNSVAEIDGGAFDACADNLTVYGAIGSYAETYAVDNGFKFAALGDFDGDNAVTTADADLLAQYALSGGGDIFPPLLDINGDGVLDLRDAAYLARAIDGWDGYAIE